MYNFKAAEQAIIDLRADEDEIVLSEIDLAVDDLLNDGIYHFDKVNSVYLDEVIQEMDEENAGVIYAMVAATFSAKDKDMASKQLREAITDYVISKWEENFYEYFLASAASRIGDYDE